MNSRKTIVFIDAGFISKLNNYFGKGSYIPFDLFKFSSSLAQKENLSLECIYYYTAPPFTSGRPDKKEQKRKEKYNRFSSKLKRDKRIMFREGRCQRIKKEGKFHYTQKGVDTLLTMDLRNLRKNHTSIKEIILIACDSDFIPVLKELHKEGVLTILYTYFDRVRDSDFSRTNELLQSVSRYVLLKREDFTENQRDEMQKL